MGAAVASVIAQAMMEFATLLPPQPSGEIGVKMEMGSALAALMLGAAVVADQLGIPHREMVDLMEGNRADVKASPNGTKEILQAAARLVAEWAKSERLQ
jgi:hypothetical protein